MNRRFDPSAPLPEAMALLAAASLEAQRLVPKAPKPGLSRKRRTFRRNPGRILFRDSAPKAPQPQLRAQPTFKRGVQPRAQVRAPFSRRAQVTPQRDTRMAAALLMAGSNKRFVPASTRRQTLTPRTTALDVIRRRALANQMIGTLRHRFSQNVLDMRDGQADTHRMAAARARFNWMPARLVAAL